MKLSSLPAPLPSTVAKYRYALPTSKLKAFSFRGAQPSLERPALNFTFTVMSLETAAQDYATTTDAAFRNQGFKYMLSHFSEVGETDGFGIYIDLVTLEKLLSSAALQTDLQAHLLVGFIWIKHDLATRSIHMARILRCLPGALLDAETLSSLTLFPPIAGSRDAQDALAVLQEERLPYHSTSEGVALGLDSVSGGGSLVFRFQVGCATFKATVDTTDGMAFVKVTLEVGTVTVSDDMDLPADVTAHIAMRLCCEGEFGSMHEVRLRESGRVALVEEGGICLLEDGWRKKWVRKFHVDQFHMAHAASLGKGWSLFVEVKEITVNGRLFAYGTVAGESALQDNFVHHPINSHSEPECSNAHRRVEYVESQKHCNCADCAGGRRRIVRKHRHAHRPTVKKTGIDVAKFISVNARL